jgi:hypothetical protein
MYKLKEKGKGVSFQKTTKEKSLGFFFDTYLWWLYLKIIPRQLCMP